MAKPTYDELQEEVAAKTAIIDRISEGALVYGMVGGIFGERVVLINAKNSLIEAKKPQFPLRPGQPVALHPQTGQIVSVGLMSPSGPVGTVTKIIDAERVLCETSGGLTRYVIVDPSLKIEIGCQIILDSSEMVALENIGKPAAEYARGGTSVSWDDIGGLAEAKREMIEAIEDPHRFPNIYAQYNQKPPCGILLEGDPGNGKTMLGKAAATALQRIYAANSHQPDSAFLYMKGPDVLDKFVGEAEGRIRAIFNRARDHKAKYGYPAVIFLDEAESLLSKRGSGVSSDMEKTIVPTFLSEMDGLDDASAIVILATNRADRLDSAIVRDGRIDRKLRIPRPDFDATREIVALNLKRNVKIASGCSVDQLSELATHEIFREDRAIGTYKHNSGTKVTLLLSDVVSGAMAANVVRLAITMAIRRDIAANKGKDKGASGVTAQNILDAVNHEQRQTELLSHVEAVDAAYKRRHGSSEIASVPHTQRNVAAA